jgi:anti-anti-sigma regulatory factor
MDMELVSKRFADTAVLFARGRVDHAAAEHFKAALAPHLATAAGRDRVVIDILNLVADRFPDGLGGRAEGER